MTPDTSGRTLPEPLAVYDPDSSCWRMFGGMFPSDSMPSLATFPASGMTRSGTLYERPTSAHRTDGRGSSSLPTPTTQPDTGNGHARSLGREVRLLPTTRTTDANGATRTTDANGAGHHGDGGPDLRTVICSLPPP
jgi:hypothetical protein